MAPNSDIIGFLAKEGGIPGVCWEAKHPLSIDESYFPELTKGKWKTVLVDDQLFNRVFEPNCIKVEYRKLFNEVPEDKSIVRMSKRINIKVDNNMEQSIPE